MNLSLQTVPDKEYHSLIEKISTRYVAGQAKAVQAINETLVQTYWQIGQYVVEFEQGGNTKAAYGKALLENLSRDLSLRHGKGFSLSNLKRMRQFYVQSQLVRHCRTN